MCVKLEIDKSAAKGRRRILRRGRLAAFAGNPRFFLLVFSPLFRYFASMRHVISSLVFLSLIFLPLPRSGPETFALSPAEAASAQLTLVAAEVCESVDGLQPQFPAIAFSIALGKISCFSAFDPVPVKTQVYHNWYYHDKLTAKIRLTLKPPNWSTFSTIQLRESDIGPWRVEITDRKGNIFKVLRFSVVE